MAFGPVPRGESDRGGEVAPHWTMSACSYAFISSRIDYIPSIRRLGHACCLSRRHRSDAPGSLHRTQRAFHRNDTT